MATWHEVRAAKVKMDAAEAALRTFQEGPHQYRSEDRMQHRKLTDELLLSITDYLDTFTSFNAEHTSS